MKTELESSNWNPCHLGRYWGWLLLGWFLMWSFLPIIALQNDFIDILENIVWGSHFQFGYDKNPYVGAWIGYFSWYLTGNTWISYILSQVFVSGGFVAIYLTAKQMMPRASALLSVIFLWGITFYSMKAAELCDDVMELGFWPWTVYFFYQALRSKHPLRNWIMTGIFAGLSLMTKYFAPALFLSMFLVMLFTKEGRAAFKGYGVYVMAAIVALISLPNLLWLLNNDFVAIDYAMSRSSLKEGLTTWTDHFYYPYRSLSRVLGVILLPLVVFGLLFFRRDKNAMTQDSFNRRFIGFIAWGPYLSTLLFSLTTGGSTNYSWVIPCFLWLGVFCFLFYQPKVTSWNFHAFILVMSVITMVFGTVFLIRSTYYQGYKKSKCDYENYPGREVAAFATREWRNFSNEPLRFIVGDRESSCNVAIYSSDHPEAYFSANPSFSQWIDEEQLRKHGGMLICRPWPEILPKDIKIAQKLYPKPKWVTRMEQDFPLTEIKLKEFRRATPEWVTRLLADYGQPQPYLIAYCFIVPQDKVEK